MFGQVRGDLPLKGDDSGGRQSGSVEKKKRVDRTIDALMTESHESRATEMSRVTIISTLAVCTSSKWREIQDTTVLPTRTLLTYHRR